jgi:DNA-binding response OmpR family regulator
MNILFIEDDELVSKIFNFHLREFGHNIFHSLSGDQVIDIYEHNRIDLIISDIMMPNNSGISAIKEIQRKYGKQVPVIIVSGIENSEVYLANRNVNYHSFIRKPFQIDVLMEKVSEIEKQITKINS